MEGSQPLEIEPAVFEPGGEVVEVDGLRPREADPTERFGIRTEQLRRCRQAAAVQRLEPGQDRGCGRPRELLTDHLEHECAPEVARPGLQQVVGVEAGVALHECCHSGICCA